MQTSSSLEQGLSRVRKFGNHMLLPWGHTEASLVVGVEPGGIQENFGVCFFILLA